MAKIDRVQDLPEWFDLDKYQGSECLDAGDWYRQLLERQSLFDACLNLKNPKPANSFDYGWYADSIKELRDSPLQLDDGIFDVENRHPPVRALRFFDLYMGAADEQARQGITGKVDIGLLFKEGHESGLEVPVMGSPDLHPALIVNLGAGDSTLRESFAIWLQAARKRRDALEVRRSRPAWNRWARYGVLPYLDLMIWSVETETHIPDRVMSAAISRYDAGEANLRKTVAPMAEALMSDLSELQAVAALDAASSPAETETFEG
jgi:hypothetical protein